MPSEEKRLLGTRFLVSFASAIVVIAGLKAARGILIPFLFALFLSVLGMGPVFYLKKRKVPTIISVIMVALLIMAIFSGIGSLLGTSVNQFTEEIPKYSSRLQTLNESLEGWLKEHNLESSYAYLFKLPQPAKIMEFVGGTLKGFVGALSNIILVIIIMVFVLLEAADLRLKLVAAFDKHVDMGRFGTVISEVQHYLAIKTVTSALTGCLVAAWTWAMGVDFWVLWGLVAFVLNYIPFIGSIIAAIPAILLALVTVSLSGAATIAIGYVVINIGVSNFIEPIFMGKRLGLSPLVVFLSLVFWGWVWGPAGMLMSVPLTMVLKILLENTHDFRWIAVLMDLKPRLPKA